MPSGEPLGQLSRGLRLQALRHATPRVPFLHQVRNALIPFHEGFTPHPSTGRGSMQVGVTRFTLMKERRFL